MIICDPEASKECLYDELQHAVAKVSATVILIPVGDWNSDISAATGVYTYGGHGFGTHSAEGERVLKFDIANGLHIGNAWSKKRDSHLITYSSGDYSTQLGYILYLKSFSSTVSKAKVIPNGKCVKQHQMVVWDFTAHIPHVKKCKFLPRASSPGSSGTE